MRQSHKESRLQRLTRAGLTPERKEALVFPDHASTEFADEWSSGPPGGSRNGKRHNPGGRG
ncbi:hypothetical protein E5161_13440 [Cohnella pontilimi]|uniref:Uncharacterized protein n=1 Tax=Cohnella pontilimi TaxID=2564100 RepID=A0A4U0FA59_9BACL|nr:hypothetical protein [Cohnella pontilimi]TJY41408.1 hypothetical protein E5161_13440 [Cohnella pontilimi]